MMDLLKPLLQLPPHLRWWNFHPCNCSQTMVAKFFTQRTTWSHDSSHLKMSGFILGLLSAMQIPEYETRKYLQGCKRNEGNITDWKNTLRVKEKKTQKNHLVKNQRKHISHQSQILKSGNQPKEGGRKKQNKTKQKMNVTLSERTAAAWEAQT